MSTPPPPRYRVVERGRRLVVIDTWDKSAPPIGAPIPTAPRPTQSSQPTRPGVMGATPQRAGGLSGMLVNLACVGAADGAGRPILTTMEYYDAKGPREIILSGAAARRLGNVMSRVAVALVLIIALMWMFPTLFFVLVVGFWGGMAMLNSAGKPMVTRWIDGLEAQSTA